MYRRLWRMSESEIGYRRRGVRGSLAGRRAGPGRRGHRGALPGHGSRHRAPIRAWSAEHPRGHAARRAALVHDVGRVAVPANVWQKPGPLTPDDRERVRLHAYHSERVLSHSPFLAALARVASAHHERLDGSGYHRGATAAALGLPARLPRDDRASAASTGARAGASRRTPRPRGRIRATDTDAVGAVLEAAGRPRGSGVRPG
jgi:hypothetical protein